LKRASGEGRGREINRRTKKNALQPQPIASLMEVVNWKSLLRFNREVDDEEKKS
jgi:hypothetical protein